MIAMEQKGEYGMSHWLCKCGYSMNDRECPNKNAYRAYSDYDWYEALEMIGDRNIHWADFRDPTYEVFKCPVCGRLMVSGVSTRFITYKPKFDEEELRAFLEAERAVPKETTQNWVENFYRVLGEEE